MSVTLALLLAAPLVGSTRSPAPTFQDMVDSAQLVVIARVDSIWEQWDTLVLDIDSTKSLWPRTYVLAELLTVYTKDTTLVPRSNSICLAYIGGCGYMVVLSPSPTFKKGELFLASVEKDKPYLVPPDEKIYRVSIKYTIANDTLMNQYTPPISLGDALQLLSSHFIVIGAEK
jgi:hypothetical protein